MLALKYRAVLSPAQTFLCLATLASRDADLAVSFAGGVPNMRRIIGDEREYAVSSIVVRDGKSTSLVTGWMSILMVMGEMEPMMDGCEQGVVHQDFEEISRVGKDDGNEML
jgi:hypothetical protein